MPISVLYFTTGGGRVKSTHSNFKLGQQGTDFMMLPRISGDLKEHLWKPPELKLKYNLCNKEIYKYQHEKDFHVYFFEL